MNASPDLVILKRDGSSLTDQRATAELPPISASSSTVTPPRTSASLSMPWTSPSRPPSASWIALAKQSLSMDAASLLQMIWLADSILAMPPLDSVCKM